jgi:glycosyltransferase involved in cell wall biosynthesis/tetratricopeptide (TPR) repeat protein
MIGKLFQKPTPRRLGNRARDKRRWAEAADHYRLHLADQPQDFAIWVQLGHMLTQLGDYPAADAAYARAGELRPQDSDLLLCWGRSRRLAGDIGRARDLYGLALASDGNAHAANELAALDTETAAIPPATPRPAPAPPPPAWAARMELLKPLAFAPGEEAVLFVTHSATGRIKPHVAPYLRAFVSAGIKPLLIIVTDREVDVPRALAELAAGVIVRANAGYDFAAWAHAIHLYPELYGAATLYLANDSLIGPSSQARFDAMLARIRDSGADLIGLTASHEYRWHLQTFLLALKPRLLSSWWLHGFFDQVRILGDKDAVIRAYEVRFASAVEQSGHRTETLFPVEGASNPTLFDWRGLIARGFPFVKTLLLRGHFPEIDLTGWRETVAEAGFDLDLIDRTLAASAESLPAEETGALVAHPWGFEQASERPLRVAFYGPWNYDNGLGFAARGTIAALQRTGARLNLHPIKKPFHIHRPLAPAVDIVDFTGDADIAIVQLNPDSWFLLTDEQRAAVRRARRRIGYWVWEMGHIPPEWHADFGSVDRIWAPSRYCADLFAREDGARVDVIPHAVPLPPAQPIDRTAVLSRFGIPADRRVILYIFDGSSYLVRKNPHALVRAFAASGLGDAGWTLLLKTKHLMDRPDDGIAFRRLAESTANVVLVDSNLPAGSLEELVAAADIYASPHCSEGFGLTIAEAMAAGKPVVATDFGGSTDQLDVTTGYPVKARRWRLDRDYGHYKTGGEWARIDEPALSAALVRAARDVGIGRNARGDAARKRIAERLSFEAVGASMLRSLREAAAAPAFGAAGRLRVHAERGTAVEQADFAPNLRMLVLAQDGSVRADAVERVSDQQGDWVVLAPAGSFLAPDFLDTVVHQAAGRPDVAILYADDVAAETDRTIDQIRLKPEFDPTLLTAQDYVGAPLIVRLSAFEALGGPNPKMGTSATADLLFRAHAAGLSIARIPRVLLAHPGPRVRASHRDYSRMLASRPGLNGAIVEGRTPGSFALLRSFPPDEAPTVTVIIPTCRSKLPGAKGTYVERLLAEIAHADWPMDRLTVLVGDDIAGEPTWARRKWPFRLIRRETTRGADEPFNYAAKMNLLWRAAETEQLLFLNDDCLPTGPRWLKALMSFATEPGVGGVGARLLYDDGRLQHAGLAPHGPAAAHLWIFRDKAEGTYQDWALVQREWSMVTGAVFATRRSVLEEVGGFEERFSLEFNDTDLCLRMRARGYRIVYTPMAELIHSEKASRGDRLPPGNEIALFLSRWKSWFENDPSWHPQLRRDSLEVLPATVPDWYI